MAADDQTPSFLDLHALRSKSRRPKPRPSHARDVPQLLFDLAPITTPEVAPVPAPVSSPKTFAEPILYTVRQLIAELRQHVEGAYAGILNVEGEI